MKPQLVPHTFGLYLGGVLGTWHFVWSVLVALGWAQTMVNTIFSLHFIKPFVEITPFEPLHSVILIFLTSVIGYLLGWLLATAWNKLQ